ncbi:uncharacterized protein [Trachinotus anak]|uniref:uncharacterized protein n=1 Tax=Trachinotus anak TaxID=443729 RepID=UPI0039F190DD
MHTMRSYTFIKVLLLCSLCRISVADSEFYTVEVQPGKEVTLLCTNYTNSPTVISWFRSVKLLNLRCISHIHKASESASYCDGFKNGRFEVASNMSAVFIKIKQVDVSDSGLYFCGYYISNKNPVIVGATYLEVEEVFGGIAKTMSMILGGLTVFFTMVTIGLVVKLKKLQKAQTEEQKAQQTQSQGSDDLNYAAVTFHPKTKRNLRPAPQTEGEPNAIYSAAR